MYDSTYMKYPWYKSTETENKRVGARGCRKGHRECLTDKVSIWKGKVVFRWMVVMVIQQCKCL